MPGNIGSTLVGLLAAAGVQVRAVSRGSRPVELPAGVEHTVADLGDLDSLSPALQGADALFLLITGEQLMTGPEPTLLVKTAADAGVRRVVFVSSQGAVTRLHSDGYARTIAFERALAESALEWTALRPGTFFSNAFAWIEPIRTEHIVPASFGDTGLPAVDPADIDAPIAFIELTPEQAKQNMLRFMPEPVADHTLTILGIPTTEEQQVSTHIEDVLGRQATTYAQWAHRNRAMYT